eukprot:TRINITY_DN1759_c0_g1_i1.p1 TRINITY_DN1759_c0_g1~~TRINITY_DN1759_c0_g1_i1.p1  ORF type:complete len:101 (+),score=34.48 TRINITY_DN1759_c0_g1_i1:113-415(+)
MSKKFIPLFDRILVKKIQQSNKTIGNIILPESAQSKINEAKVIAVGQGRRNIQGDLIPISIKVGDRVLLSEGFNGTDITLGGEDLQIYREEDILGKIEEI